jgi:hypothetical protein
LGGNITLGSISGAINHGHLVDEIRKRVATLTKRNGKWNLNV